MKKIVAINGSHRKNGYSNFLLEKMGNGIKKANVDFEIIHLRGKKINPCISCGTCHTEKSWLKCIYAEKDDVCEIFNKIREADLVIYATPIYVGTMSGLMKILFDRFFSTFDINNIYLSKNGLIHHFIDHSLNSKPFVTQIICNGLEDIMTRNTVNYFKDYSKIMEAENCGIIVRNAVRMSGYGKEPPLIESMRPKYNNIHEAFELAGEEIAKLGRITKRTLKKTGQDVFPIPFAHFLKKLPFVKRKIVQMAHKNSNNLKSTI